MDNMDNPENGAPAPAQGFWITRLPESPWAWGWLLLAGVNTLLSELRWQTVWLVAIGLPLLALIVVQLPGIVRDTITLRFLGFGRARPFSRPERAFFYWFSAIIAGVALARLLAAIFAR